MVMTAALQANVRTGWAHGESRIRFPHEPDSPLVLDDVSLRIEPREFIGMYSVPSVTVSVECWKLSWRGGKGNPWFHKSG